MKYREDKRKRFLPIRGLSSVVGRTLYNGWLSLSVSRTLMEDSRCLGQDAWWAFSGTVLGRYPPDACVWEISDVRVLVLGSWRGVRKKSNRHECFSWLDLSSSYYLRISDN